MQAVAALIVMCCGVGMVYAGPGGGTYYANTPSGGVSGTALRKFVDSLPGVGATNANNLGQYIPLAVPDTTTFAGSDYYVIGLKEYSEKMHTDLPKPTKLRGYYQKNTADPTVSANHYLGPLILARSYDPTKPAGVAGNGKPVRVKFVNELPTGAAGNLFLPTDLSLMGAGRGPTGNFPSKAYATRTVPAFLNYSGNYAQSRATLHLHGGNTPWISDGTPHQWTVPVGELSTPYQKGLSTQDVPDMPASDQGEMTFYWTNQQSSRLMFYHDHSYGTTRLNVYAGEAAGYLLADATEDGMIDSGVLPNVCPGGPTAFCAYRYGIPLVIQDKTFVPQNIDVQDAAWNHYLPSISGPKYDTQNPVLRDKTKEPWGVYGDLWFPHVIEANQDPASSDGANPFGRWDYGPWFWPPVIIDPKFAKLPDPSATPEAFMDTPVINGTAYPYLNVEPRAYRFRVLNASNDRPWNLSIFYADPGDPTGKEVKMLPAGPNPAFPADWPTDGRDGGVPDPASVGPNMIQIANEGGFLRSPVVIPNRPIGYDYNRRNIVVLNSIYRSLFLAPAERADVIVDFSAVPPGSTLILYNDAPAPNPAFDPRYDFFTGSIDYTTSGGAPSPTRGYGPNTRTIMQFRVVAAAGPPAAAFNVANLQTALPVAYDATQAKPIVPQTWAGAATDIYSRIQDYSVTIPVNDPVVNPTGPAIPKTIPFQPKAIQELWDSYGRMNATLGVELPFTSNLIQTTIPMGYVDTPTEIFTDGQPQIWKITHNGVDTHPVHFHQFNVQLINRVGWDGAIRPPDDNELGWKETVRMNPLEDAVVALLPKSQVLPFALPDSIRPIDVTANTSTSINIIQNPFRNGATIPFLNVPQFYGNEYVWHCHILGHEENDFMRPMIFLTSNTAPPQPSALSVFTAGQTVPGDAGAPTAVIPYVNQYANQIVLQWKDGVKPYRIGSIDPNFSATPTDPSLFLVESSTDGGVTWLKHDLVSFLPEYPAIWTDTSVAQGTSIQYRVTSYNSYIPPASPPGTTGSYSAPLLSSVIANTGTWAHATAVTITPGKPSPHVVGTLVQFASTASTTPAPATPVAYEYRFWLSTNGGAKVLVQNWSLDNTWNLPATAVVGTYVITSDARTSPNNNTVATDGGYDARATLGYTIIVPPIAPVTLADPIPGIYTAAPITVTLTATGQAAIQGIYYTTDGSAPSTLSTKYTVPIVLNASTTINYYAVDVNGNAEAPHSDTWSVQSLADMVSTIKINGGNSITNSSTVTLSLMALDAAGVATMQFADGDAAGVCPVAPAAWSSEIPYATTYPWTMNVADTLHPLKTVCVRFRDKSLPFSWAPPAAPVGGFLYPAISAAITYDNILPQTAATPAAGTYVSGPVSVTLTANKAGSTIYYTVGTIAAPPATPTIASTIYTVPIPVSNIPGVGTVISYFSVDSAGNVETVKTGTWVMAANQLVASVAINGGATLTNSKLVTLALSAVDTNPNLQIVTMQFSNVGGTDPANWSVEETYNTQKLNWDLAFPGISTTDGPKTVYVRFRNNALPSGYLYAPVTASITLDTTKPVTTASPIAGIYANAPVPVTLTANEPATIYYTIDGSTPTFPIAATTTQMYVNPIQIAADTTINFFAIDTAGNAESVNTGTWHIHVGDLTASVVINNGQAVTKSTTVNLTLNAVDATGIADMRFSNTGNVNVAADWTTPEPYATGKSWILPSGDGQKTVYVQFRDGSGNGGILYPPVTASIILDTTLPVTTAGPVPGTYSVAPDVTLIANEPATIYYTLDGSTPTTASAQYVSPIHVSASTTVTYFAVDTAGNSEPVKSATWIIHTGDLIVNTFTINGGAASTNDAVAHLAIDAVDPGTGGVNTMAFSNDGLSYSVEEPYTTNKTWRLTPGDGQKVVYAVFRDNSLPNGLLYSPVTTTILLDTTAPVTTATPVPGTYSSLAPNPPVNVTLTCSDGSGSGCSKIYYTTDGSDPTAGSTLYTAPILVSASTTIKYRSVDKTGNLEAVKTGIWDIHPEDLVANIKINNGGNWTDSPAVTLNLSAQDGTGIKTMQFSNDGVTYTAEETFPADGINTTTATKTWTLTPGEGTKTVYVRFRDGAGNGGNLYAPITATILFGTKDGLLPGTSSYLASSLRALRIASGFATATPVDLVHADIAPFSGGTSHPDGKIDLLDVYTIMLRSVGLITISGF